MAITIISNFTSGGYYPSSNPINCTISSNNSGKCNFRYICDIYINNVKVFSDKLFPDPNTGYAFFQLSRVIQDYIQTSLPKTPYVNLISPAMSTSAPSAAFSVFCKFGEEYDNSTTCDGQVSQYLNLGQSNTFSVFESAISYEDFPSFSYGDYLFGTASATKKFLTNSPRELDVTFNDSYYLDFITDKVITASYSLRVEVFSATGSIATKNYTRNLGNYKRVRLAVGPYDINYYDDDTTINGIVKYYTVKWMWNNVQISEVFRFNVKQPKTFRTRLSFIGLLGSPESYTFYHRNRSTYNIERKNYERTLQSVYSGSQWKYEVGDRGTTTFAVNATETHTVASFVEKEVSEWLTEMWLSPEVWTYLRPDLLAFRPFKQGLYVYFQLYNDHDLEVGDVVYVISDNLDYDGKFTVNYVDGQTIGLNMLYSIYGATMEGTCGFVQKKEDWRKLPIVISDNSVEVKQKTGRPIEYQLNYAMSYPKNTLRP